MSTPITKFGKIEEELKELEEDAVSLPFVVDNFLGKRGGEIKGSIDMTGQPIKNLADPLDGGDAVNKKYVDYVKGGVFERTQQGDYVAKENLLMNNKKIQGLPMPVDEEDASNKIYVDTLTEDRRRKLESNNPFTFDNGAYTAKGKIDMRGFKIENAENIENAFLKRNGGYDAQDHIYLKYKKLGGLRDPIADREATNKRYVDEQDENIKKELSEHKQIYKDNRRSTLDRISINFYNIIALLTHATKN